MNLDALKRNVASMSPTDPLCFTAQLIMDLCRNVRNFDRKNVYIRNEIVYFYDVNTKRHTLYRCNVNATTVNTDLNPTQWIEVTLKDLVTPKPLVYDLLVSSDLSSIKVPGVFNELEHDLHVYHSLIGKLNKDTHYTINNKTITFNNFTIKNGERLRIEVFI